MSPEYAGYRDLEERLDEFRSEIVGRMVRHDEWGPRSGFERLDLTREPGTSVRVDSFLGTQNTTSVPSVYFRVVDAAKGQVETLDIDFAVEQYDHPRLAQLRDHFDLESVAGAADDVTRAIRIRDWIKSLFSHRIPYRMPEWDAFVILDRGQRGVEHFICIHYSVSLVQCCLALGMQARMINLHRGISGSYVIGEEASANPPVDEHVVAEVWSSELEKWVMMDVDFDVHYERDGTPLSAWEIHQAYVSGQLAGISCHRGPHSEAFTAMGDGLPDDEFFGATLPAYYAHVSVLMRNNFLSDPDGPVPAVHLTDDSTEPVLWHRGSDMRLQPHLMGPVVVAEPYRDTVAVLTDGNRRTGWASEDRDGSHWVEIQLPGPRVVGRVALTWPEYASYYRTSSRFAIEVQVDGAWRQVFEAVDVLEAPFTVHDIDPVVATGLRILQSPGGGFREHAQRLWLNQIEVFGPLS